MEIMSECGKIWEICHSSAEIRGLEGMHLSIFMEQREARLEELQDCPLYKELR